MTAPTARDVIVTALTARHEELHGEAMPRDFDGASQILRALNAAGFVLIHRDELRVVTSGMSYHAVAVGPLYHTREAAVEALEAKP